MNIEIDNPSSFRVFSECVGLEGLLSLIKTESERYALQNGRVFQTTAEELSAFLGINILMGIHKLPSMKVYWSVEIGLGNPLIQMAMTRAGFLEIPPKDSDRYDCAWKLRPLSDVKPHAPVHEKQADQMGFQILLSLRIQIWLPV